ncbi:hypothetical protein [Psychrobacter namhaensis]|uniref:hypothetical protein n=1 Tax=Psychrobacter namhaensis TaxID=292734 RepID=UPI0018DFA3E5|nr:hypothetical protein [Psychrobacter namhaensis]
MTIKFNGLEFNDVEFEEINSRNIFRIYDNERKSSLDFEYKPTVYTEYDKNDYQLILLENKYLKAENDVFQVFGEKIVNGKPVKNCLGWIFTISNLESLEHDYVDNVHLNKYKFVAFLLILLNCNKEFINYKEKYSLSDIYEDDVIVFIVCKKNLNSITESNIYDYFPSLIKYEYNHIENTRSISHKKYFLDEIRNKDKIVLKETDINIRENEFLYNLFTKYLKNLEHSLLRFHLLYQVVEYCIDIIFDNKSDKIIKKFSDNQMSKNEFIERISSSRKERTRVNILTENIVKQSEYSNLKDNCVELLNSCKREPRNTIGDLIYDVRNLVVHDFKIIKDTEYEKLTDIVNDFEMLVVSIVEDFLTTLE